MKKIVVLLVLIAVIGCGSVFAVGIGVEAGLPFWGNLPGNNVMLSLKLDNAPLLGIGVGNLGGNNVSIGLIADWWLIQGVVVGPLEGFVGLGAYAAIVTGDPAQFAIGARLPLGLQLFITRWFELFAEIAPALGIVVSNQADFGFNIQGAVGLRFWF